MTNTLQSSSENSSEQRIATNLRMLLIVEAFCHAGGPLTPTEINQTIGLPKQSLHRLCNSLLDEGFLARDFNPKKLIPGGRMMRMASGVFTASHVHIARHQILQRVANQVMETVNLVIPEQSGMIYVDRIETNWPFRVQFPVGTSVPFHCTASGKCFLASLPTRRLGPMLESLPLEKLARNTHTSLATLKNDLKQIAATGISFDNEEFFDDMIAVATPVFDQRGDFYAAIAFQAPMQRMSFDDALLKAPILKQAAKDMSQILRQFD